ncbi:hypothetical protein IMCC3317_11380 [Kordia antarctica]|uniref:Peptidase C14 caspase domain-containing protein n=1 Tax=Kordia antarctica TaxID=1218801 RepID=A0A7L4ZGY3_9FLAO|nr:caspase family protein [Kordia antarctica]QHI35790.1 hypothetical protein IMCC3317_11380 [Kordia antarctica]
MFPTKKALLIGIDNYDSSKLVGCVNDVIKLDYLLSIHDDKFPNFERKLMLAPLNQNSVVIENDQKEEFLKINTNKMLEGIKELFSHKAELALLYYSGHGFINEFGGFLVAQDGENYDAGVRMRDIMTIIERASKKKIIQEIIVILDCCHSGLFGNVSDLEPEIAKIPQGVTIIAACEHFEFATCNSRGGILTKGICNALNGGGADPLGNITAMSLYSHLTGSLSSAWSTQTLVFKTNITKKYNIIKKCHPDFEFSILKLIPNLFKDINYEYILTPSMITIDECGDQILDGIAKRFLKLMKLGMIEIIGNEDIVYAIINSSKCRLTPLGRYYWRKLKIDNKT